MTLAHWGSTSNPCLVNSYLPLLLSRNAEFERGKSVFIHGNLTLQSVVNKRRIRFRFVRLFMQGHDTEIMFWHKQLEVGFGHWKFCPYLKIFCRETLVLLFHVILCLFVAVLIQVFAVNPTCLVTSRLVFIKTKCCGLFQHLNIRGVFVAGAMQCPQFQTDLWQSCALME